MDNDILKLGSIIGVGVLATSLVIGSELPTYTTMLEPELFINSITSHKIGLSDYPDYFKNTALFSFQYDRLKIGSSIEDDAAIEIEMVEVPIVNKLVFQFNKPIKLDFS